MPSEVKGMMVQCARCGDKFFRRRLEDRHTWYGSCGNTYEVCEELPEDWLYESEFGYLCPVCACAFKDLLSGFFDGDLSKLPPKWRVD